MRCESAVPMLMLGMLSACGGGPVCCVDAGAGGGVRPIASFVAFSEIGAGETARATAVTQTSSSSAQAAPAAGGSVDLTFDAGDMPTMVTVETAGATAVWSGDDIDCGGARCSLNNGEAVGTLIDPGAAGWNYQTFGYWIDGSGSRSVTAFSTGSPTPAAALMSRAAARYAGTAGGLYVNGDGTVYQHAAQMNAEVNFASRTIGFSTTGTRLTATNSSFSLGAPQLDMSGTLSVQGAQFSGRVQTPGFGFGGLGSFRGTASGTLYGPDAEEIGGVFDLRSFSGGSARLTGAFGGKR